MAGKMFMASFTYKISWWVGATLDHRLALSSPVRADSAESCAVSLRHTGSVPADCWLQNTLQNPMRNEHIFDATNQLIASGTKFVPQTNRVNWCQLTSAQLRTETSTFQWGQCVSRDFSWARLKHLQRCAEEAGGDNIPLTNWFRRMGHYTHLQDIPRTAPELSAEPLEPLELSPVPAMSVRAWKRGLRGLSCPLGTRKCVSWIKFNPKKYDSMTSIGKDGLYKQLVYQFISDINDVPPEVRSRCRWHPNTGVRWTWFVRRHVATKDSDYRHRQYRFVSKWQISQHFFKTIINHSLMVKMMWFYDGKTWCENVKMMTNVEKTPGMGLHVSNVPPSPTPAGERTGLWCRPCSWCLEIRLVKVE